MRSSGLLAAFALTLGVTGLVCAAAPGDAPESQTANTLVLVAPAEASEDVHGGLFARELARQALWLAASEELRLTPCDAVLGEKTPAGGEKSTIPAPAFNVRLALKPGKEASVECLRMGDKPTSTPERIFTAQKTLAAAEVVDYLVLAEWLEELARTELPPALARAGFVEKSRQPASTLEVPAAVEQQLSRMTWLSQFAALRALDELSRQKGTSPVIAGAQVRGYAHLAVLCEMHWHPAFEVFRARALLLAQRLVASDPKGPLGRWHRAYALAFCGLHHAALDDIARAARLQAEQSSGGAAAPAWAPMIEAFCRFDTAKLSDKSTAADLAELAALAKLLTLEEVSLASAFAEENASDRHYEQLAELARRVPHCRRLSDSAEAVGSRPEGTGAEEFTARWYAAVGEIAGCPAAAREITAREAARAALPPTADIEATTAQTLAEAESRAKLVGALAAGQDKLQPSTAALAMLVQETTFLDARDEAFELQSGGESSDKDEFRKTVKLFQARWMPVLAGHPLKKYIESYLQESAFRRESMLNDLLKTVDTASWQANHQLMLSTAALSDATRVGKLGAVISRHLDHDYRGLVTSLAECEERENGAWALRLYRVSLHSPLAAAGMIENHWSQVREHAKAWEQKYAGHIDVLGSLARQFVGERRFDDARRCLNAYIRLFPSQWAYVQLADCYRLEGNTPKWLETLEDFLKLNQSEWEQAEVQVAIARHYVAIGKYDTALPYALAAARETRGEGTLVAAECYEYLRDWARAERWFREGSQFGHAGDLTTWYEFCLRTGYGNSNLARARALSLLGDEEEGEKSTDSSQLAAIAYWYLVDDRPRRALAELRRSLERTHDPHDGLHAALIAHQLRRTDERDAALRETLSSGAAFEVDGQPRQQLLELARLFQASWQKRDAKLDREAVERLAAAAPTAAERANIWYFSARHCELAGDRAATRRDYSRCVRVPARTLGRTLACTRLREWGIEPNNLPLDSSKK